MTARHWVGLVVISLLGIGAMVWLMPLSARVPIWVTADVYNRFKGYGASAKPFDFMACVTPICVGIGIVVVCALLFCGLCCWIDRSAVVKNVPWQQEIERRQND
jgi:hypothetical protein